MFAFAMHKLIMPQHPLPCGQKNVRRDEATGFRVIVAALQIVSANFAVVDVAPITEGVVQPNRAQKGAGA